MMSIIVIMQFMGLDLLGFITKADSIIYGTLYNSNYVGSYLSLTLPLIIYNHEYNANRLVYCLLLLLNILALIMSNSRSSLIAIVIGCIFMVIYERNRFINILNAFLTYVLCIFVLGVVYGYGGDSNYKLRSVVADDVKITIGSVESLKGIDVKGNEIQLKFNSGVDNIKLDGDKLLINKEVVQLKNNIKYNKLLRDYIILEVDNIDGNYIIRFSYKGTKRYKNDKLSYIYIGNEFKYLIRDMYICDIEDMNNRYLGHIGSGRFYIWFNSVKLIKDSIFKGYGADTFALHFNQYDLSNKFVYLYTPYILVDKPHNVYIKIAIENGLIGLVGLLLYIYYIVKNSENKMGLKYAVISYLVCSLFNDWSIGVTILLWVYLGVLSRYTKD
ncbi:MAG: O-antigen ligase family protein, partial [Candidatus Anstonellales archaeon]